MPRSPSMRQSKLEHVPTKPQTMQDHSAMASLATTVRPRRCGRLGLTQARRLRAEKGVKAVFQLDHLTAVVICHILHNVVDHFLLLRLQPERFQSCGASSSPWNHSGTQAFLPGLFSMCIDDAYSKKFGPHELDETRRGGDEPSRASEGGKRGSVGQPYPVALPTRFHAAGTRENWFKGLDRFSGLAK